MAKTITLRIDDDTYNLIKKAASGERRTLSNFIEYATISYLSEESFVSDDEMNEILQNTELVKELKLAEKEIETGDYRVIG